MTQVKSRSLTLRHDFGGAKLLVYSIYQITAEKENILIYLCVEDAVLRGIV